MDRLLISPSSYEDCDPAIPIYTSPLRHGTWVVMTFLTGTSGFSLPTRIILMAMGMALGARPDEE